MHYTAIIQKLSESLKNAYKNNIHEHSGNKGSDREKEVIRYLSKVMPRNYGFQSGEVFDQKGENAGQVDVIIYDNLYSPIFTSGNDTIVAPVESTYGIISVKSKMGTKKLDQAIDGIKKYERLSRMKGKSDAAYLTPFFHLQGSGNINISSTIQQNINCIFAFDTTIATKTIKQKVIDSDCVDLLVVPGKICAFGRRRNDVHIDLNKAPFFNSVVESQDSIALFTVFLQGYLINNKLIGVDIRELMLQLIKKQAEKIIK